MREKKGIRKYFSEYTPDNLRAMLKNNKSSPRICETAAGGKFVVITGATSGIGYYTAHKYASMGADLLCINRSEEKSQNLCKEIRDKYKTACDYMLTDFSEMSQVKKLAEQLKNMDRAIDVLIHNAGIYLTHRTETEEGLETVFVVNHLSSFYLNRILLPLFKKNKKGRIILVSSEGHRFAPWGLHLDDLDWKKRRYSGMGAYGSAKLSQMLSMLIFAEELEGSGATINAMHPGAVKTESGKDNGSFYKWYKEKIIERNFREADISAESLYTLGIHGDFCQTSGRFYNLTTLEDPAPPAVDREEARKLYDLSMKMCQLD